MTEVLIDEWINAPEGMPRFGLRGDDPEAPEVILHWVSLRRHRLAHEVNDCGQLTDTIKKELQQCTEAEQIAWQMQEFQRGYEAIPIETFREDQKTAQHHARRVDNAIAEIYEAIVYLNALNHNVPPQFAHSLKHLRVLSATLRDVHRKGS